MRRATPSSKDTAPWPREIDAGAARRLLGAVGDILLWLDADDRIVDVHAHDREMQKAARRDWRGRTWLETVTVESREKVSQLLEVARGSGDAPPEWRQVNHPQRNEPDLPVMYAALRLSRGARSRGAPLVAIGRDLRSTEALQRRLVEAQQSMERDYWRFREAEARYRSLFQASGEAVLIVDAANLRVTEVNPAAQSLLGEAALARPGRPGRVVGAVWTSLFEAEAAEPLAAALAAARSVGKHDAVITNLAGQARSVAVSLTLFRQDEASFLLVRLNPRSATSARRGAPTGRNQASGLPASDALPDAFVRGAADAVVFTDASGRVLGVNRSFVRLAQLSSEDQARGQMLDRWLGRTGVELSVLLANLRKDGAAGLFTTQLRGELGVTTEVEIAASTLDHQEDTRFAFAVRDIGRRLAPPGPAEPEVPTSVKQLAELVGRVPLKQIVAETSDLIERMSIESALVMTRDNRAMAAQLLGLSRQSLYVKLRRFGLGGLGPEDAP